MESETLNFIEEAHLLSLVYSELGVPFGNANDSVKRIWTQVLHHNNRASTDLNLVCWHLPAEKRFGIRRTANKYLQNDSLEWPKYQTSGWQNLIQQIGVTKPGPKKIFYDFCISGRDRILNIFP